MKGVKIQTEKIGGKYSTTIETDGDPYSRIPGIWVKRGSTLIAEIGNHPIPEVRAGEIIWDLDDEKGVSINLNLENEKIVAYKGKEKKDTGIEIKKVGGTFNPESCKIDLERGYEFLKGVEIEYPANWSVILRNVDVDVQELKY
ncbi:MAG: hypothetical protein QXX01_03305 [Candidatus Aenigmatarchaeota archaeon]